MGLTKAERLEADQVRTRQIATMRAWAEKDENPVLYTMVVHVSASGMTRDIAVLANLDGEVCNISFMVARIVGYPIRNNGVRVSGAGMDMGFHLIYVLSQELFGVHNGYTIKHRRL